MPPSRIKPIELNNTFEINTGRYVIAISVDTDPDIAPIYHRIVIIIAYESRCTVRENRTIYYFNVYYSARTKG